MHDLPGATRRLTPEAAVTAVAAQVATLPRDRTVWIAVDGGGASGKTTFAARLAATIGAEIIHGDDFARPGLATWDQQRFLTEVVEPLRAGRTARYDVRGWDAADSRGRREVAPGRPLVVEGVSVTDRSLAVDWDLIVWLDAPREVRLARALARDGEVMRHVWEDEWLPSEERWMTRDRPWERADVVVDAAD